MSNSVDFWYFRISPVKRRREIRCQSDRTEDEGRGVRLTKSDGTGPVSVGLLDSSSGRRSLLGGLGGELLSGTEQGR